MKCLWVILLPIKFICSACSVILRCEILKLMMDCLRSSPEPEETRRLKERLKHRNTLDKNFKSIGKRLFVQLNSGGVGGATQANFEDCLYDIDQAHQGLIDFVKQYLTDTVITNIFISKKLERKTTIVENELAKLKSENLIQKERYENIIATNTKSFNAFKRETEHRYSDLATYCQYLEKEKKHSQRTNNVSSPSRAYHNFDYPETIYKRKQQQFEETLKAQNDLIQDLKRQLLECRTELINPKLHHSNLVQKQPYYYDSNEILLNQKNMVQIENEKKKAEEQQIIEQKQMKQQQDLENEIRVRQRNILQRDQQIQNLHQQNKNLQEQLAKPEENFNQDGYNLEAHYKSQGVVIDNLKQLLSNTANERDSLKTQNAKLLQEIEQMENNHKKAMEQKNLEQMHLEKLQAVQAYQSKIEMLKTSLHERGQQIQNLQQQNKNLLEQLAIPEENFKQEWYNLQMHYTNQGALIDNLKQRLSNTANERDSFKTQNDKLLQEIEQMENNQRKAMEQKKLEQMHLEKPQAVQQTYQSRIEKLHTTLHERDQHIQNLQQQYITIQEEFSKFEANVKQEWYNLKKHYEIRLSDTANERDAFKTQVLNLQNEIQQHNVTIRSLNNEIVQLRNESKNLTTKPDQTRTQEKQAKHVNVETQNINRQEAENDYVRESLKKIEHIFENAERLEKEVKEFSGTKKDKTFLHFQELLIRDIVKLDNVESEGYFVIRKRRKEVIQYVQSLLDILKEKP